MNKREVFDGNTQFQAFEVTHGTDAATEVMERIADAMWSREGVGIHVRDFHTINASNHVMSGIIDYAGERFGFVVESGDNAGTVIHEWGDPEDVGCFEPPRPTLYTFVPLNDNLKAERPAMYDVYLHWTTQAWFKDKERAYNYDRHFQPGWLVENHYREWAAKKGLKIAIKEDGE